LCFGLVGSLARASGLYLQLRVGKDDMGLIQHNRHVTFSHLSAQKNRVISRGCCLLDPL